MREGLRILGDRLDRPGKERVVFLGTVNLDSPAVSIPFRFVWQIPDHARLEIRVVPVRVLIFDGAVLKGAISRQDEDLVENLFYDTAEHFFLGQMQGLATRFLGSRFRQADGTGPSHDLYQVTDQINLGSPARRQPKLYYFDSDSLLLERVRYQFNRDGTRTNVDIQLSNWQKVRGESFPARLARLENGQPVFTLTITSISVGPRANDGMFSAH